MPQTELTKRILALRASVIANFNAGDWEETGLLTGFSEEISHHPRLLRSLGFGDEDYSGNALSIIKRIAEEDKEDEHQRCSSAGQGR